MTRSVNGQDQAGYHYPPALTDDSGAHPIELGDGDPMNDFEAELAHALRVVQGQAAPESLDPRLARDAIRLCERQAAKMCEVVR